VSTDPEFAPKAADVVGLYLNPPENALVISVDEKPSIQALEQRTGYLQRDSGKIVRGYKRTYKRHGAGRHLWMRMTCPACPQTAQLVARGDQHRHDHFLAAPTPAVVTPDSPYVVTAFTRTHPLAF